MHHHQLGIQGTTAPELKAVTWLSGAKETQFHLGEVTEPLIYLYFFQAWCPGCHSRGFPTLAKVKQYVEDQGYGDLVRFAAVQTVFEGHEDNTPQAALDSVAKHGLADIALGHDEGDSTTTMADYRSGGTPWTVLIGPGPSRTVLGNGFHIEAADTIALIDQVAQIEGRTTTKETL